MICTDLHEAIKAKGDGKVKLHLGCGGTKWKDFINIDFYPHDNDTADSSRYGCVADVFADIRSLDLPENSVDEMFTSHTFEHFTRWEAIDMLTDWYRMLKPSGTLIVETPDFWRCVIWLFHPSAKKRHLGWTQFYGNQWDRLDFETHRYVWSAGEISKTCKKIGFSKVFITHKTETHCKFRDMRIVATK
ncbi:MAG: methyltransferase domain-containing protein [Geobacter sp.]